VLGLLAGPHFGDYQAGLRFGRLGYELVEQRGLKLRNSIYTLAWKRASARAFNQFIAESAESKSSLIVAEVRSGEQAEHCIGVARTVTVAALNAEIDLPDR